MNKLFCKEERAGTDWKERGHSSYICGVHEVLVRGYRIQDTRGYIYILYIYIYPESAWLNASIQGIWVGGQGRTCRDTGVGLRLRVTRHSTSEGQEYGKHVHDSNGHQQHCRCLLVLPSLPSLHTVSFPAHGQFPC